MNAFESACGVEATGMAILLPYLEERSDRLVLTSKGTLSKHLQLIAGDVLMNAHEKIWGVEIKIERRFTGNLFLETWSNRNLEDKKSHAEHGSNPGWMMHTQADILMYYFLDTDDLYVIDIFNLKRWSFGHGDRLGNIYDWPERLQGKYAQKNDTRGRCVPVDVLRNALSKSFKHCNVKQLPLLAEAA